VVAQLFEQHNVPVTTRCIACLLCKSDFEINSYFFLDGATRRETRSLTATEFDTNALFVTLLCRRSMQTTNARHGTDVRAQTHTRNKRHERTGKSLRDWWPSMAASSTRTCHSTYTHIYMLYTRFLSQPQLGFFQLLDMSCQTKKNAMKLNKKTLLGKEERTSTWQEPVGFDALRQRVR
jgi:hypothetical protein